MGDVLSRQQSPQGSFFHPPEPFGGQFISMEPRTVAPFGPEQAIEASIKQAVGLDPGFFGPMMIESNLNSGAIEPLSSLPSSVFGVPTLGQERTLEALRIAGPAFRGEISSLDQLINFRDQLIRKGTGPNVPNVIEEYLAIRPLPTRGIRVPIPPTIPPFPRGFR